MKVLVAGDFRPFDRVSRLFEKEEYNVVFGEVKELITESDYSIVNLECPVTYGGEKAISKIGPELRCSKKDVGAIKWVGFNCVTLANNHFFDYGNEGVVHTLETCREYEIDSVGGGIDIEEASQVLYKKIGNKVLAIINCCEHEFSIATAVSSGSNPLNPVKQYYDIKESRQKADYVLVIVHGGHEHFQLPSPRMIETYRFFIDAGADAVVNHHQHCFSGYEVYNGKPIFYGLGNFCFDEPTCRSGIWTEGFMVAIELNDDVEPLFTIHPYRQCFTEPRVELLPHNIYDERLLEINKIISSPAALQQAMDKYYDSFIEQCSNIFEPFRNRFYLAAKHRGLLPSLIGKKRKLVAANYILCEAHRDQLEHWFKNNPKI